MKIIINEIDGTIVGNKVNLCESCNNEYPRCMAGSADVLYGDDKDDNVCCCSYYEPIKKKEQMDDWKEVIQIVSDADVVIEAEGSEE